MEDSSFTYLNFYIQLYSNKISFTKATCSTTPGCSLTFFLRHTKGKAQMTQEHSFSWWKQVTLKRCCKDVMYNVMYVFLFLPLKPRPFLRHTFPEFIRKCTSRHFLKSAHVLPTQIFAWDRFFSIFLPFSLFFFSSLHFAWCYSYCKQLEAMRKPGETSEARVQSETTSKGRFL